MLLNKKFLMLMVLFLLLFSFISYAEICDVSRVKDVLKKNLYLYFQNRSASPLTVNEVKDLLNAYLKISSDAITFDCSSVGGNSNKPISAILTNGDNATSVIPACADGTKYGECSSTKPGFCYAGSILGKCGYCGCPSGSSCTATGKCAITNLNVTCYSNRDCGARAFTGNYFCSNNYITKNYINYTCIDPGTANSKCISSNIPVFLNYCNINLNDLCVEGYSYCQKQITSSTTITTSPACSDSDGGQNFYVRGTTSKGTLNYSDYCGTGNNLFENYCDANGNIQINYLYVCPSGCSDGACINATTPCVDSDNGLNYYIKGAASKGSLNYSDYCGAQTSDGRQYVLEQYCDSGNNIAQSSYLCPGYCSDGACINNTTPCTDTDGGLNFYVKGFTNKGTLNYSDYCGTGNNLFENYCDASGNLVINYLYSCPSGCSDGACVNATSPCIDTDGGQNYYVKGITSKGNLNYSDYCGAGSNLYENYCDSSGNIQTNSLYVCPNGCSNGACINATTPCVDTDGGKNFDVKGTTSKGTLSYTDYCGSGNNLFENYCDADGNIQTNFLYSCPNGCSDGACINATTCTDSDGGLNYYVQGTVKKGTITSTDYCGAQTSGGRQYVLEQYCDSGNNIAQSAYLCSALCSNGACI